MFKFSRLGKLVIVAALLSVGVFASVAYATHSWGPYHWARTSNPFTVKLGDNVSSAWDSYLATASTDWSVSSVLDTTVVAGNAGSNLRRCRATNGRVEVCNTTYGNTGWLGVASIWVDSSNHITQGTVKLNDTYFNTATYNTPDWRQFVTCQEVGHTFGLDHQDTNFSNTNLGTCMDYTNDPSGTAGTNGTLNNEHPNQHDYDELAIIYNHLDSYTTLAALLPPAPAGPGKSGRADTDLSDPGEWGTILRHDGKGHPSLYGRDLGHGEKVFTFVFWANEK
ncbi:MAG: hypothetical protein HY093_03005 [Candidatus Liptonbacteria bacterium]|nr:hypothetical protein [Candidatus Liptonbacteria bacterium]